MVERIKALRKALGLNQTEFGKKLGLSTSAVSSIELGERPVQERHIKLILSEFPTVSESWLRTGDGEMFVTEDNPIKAAMRKYDFPDIVEKLLVAYSRLNDEEKEAVLKYTIDFVSEFAVAVPDDETPPFEEMDIDAEVEAYRQQLIQQQESKGKSYRSDGTGTIGGTA